MSLKQEIESWVAALDCYDRQDYEKALEIFEENADTSKIYFNIGMIHATLGEHEKAVESYQRATKLDSFLAVAYFQMGVSNFLLGEFTEAMANFNESLLYLRGNTLIDYEQLGLKFKLFSCEVLFNRGLCYIYDQQIEAGMQDLEYAAKEKQVEDHGVIDEAIKEQAEGYTVFSVGVGVLYRPNESKVRNIKAKDYLGKARLVAASDAQNAFTGFAGTEVQKQAAASTPSDDRPPAEISFAASNLVKKELTSRRKSEPQEEVAPAAPAKPEGPPGALRGERQVFPPTPPPENEFVPYRPSRANTVAASASASTRSAPIAQRSLSSREPNGRADGRDRGREPPRRRNEDFDEGGAAYGRGRPHRPTVNTTVVVEPRRAYSARGGPSSATASPARHRMPPDQLRPGPPPRRHTDRISEYSDEIQSNPYSDELYDYYTGEQASRDPSRRGESRRGESRRQDGGGTSRAGGRGRLAEEEEEYASDAYEGSSFGDEDEFEMLDARSMRSGSSRRPDVKKIKIKAHNGDDTRIVLIPTGVDYDEFVNRMKEKFGFRRNIRCKIRDEDGDGMVGVMDQEDLDIAIASSKKAARRERAEFGKLEVWVVEI